MEERKKLADIEVKEKMEVKVKGQDELDTLSERSEDEEDLQG